VDAEFIYVGSDTVRRYDPKDGKKLNEMTRVPEAVPQGGALAAFVAKYPPATPIIVGDIEEIRIDPSVRELYCTDTYLGGRVMVFSMDTFQFKRGWGAHGKPLSQISSNDADHAYRPNAPLPREFTGHLSLNLSKDGFVYIADRIAKRIQVTDQQGKFLKEFNLAPSMGAGGAVASITFSGERQQRYLYVADSGNNTVWVLNREDGRVLGRLSGVGDAGQFQGLSTMATDSRGNVYTGEVQTGERVKRFVPATE
jgi:DNA-binding beta-propeller fold protein YncE